jgi:protein-tyrosine phosphatase
MKPDLYKVSKIGKGKLFVMPKPSSEWLSEDTAHYSSMGVSVILSLMEVGESYECGLQKEQEILSGFGIEFSNFQIKDRGLPNLADFRKLIRGLYVQVSEGANLAVHCRAGIGRSGVVASCILIEDGADPQHAIDMVSAARRVSIPDTQEQYDFIMDYYNGAII